MPLKSSASAAVQTILFGLAVLCLAAELVGTGFGQDTAGREAAEPGRRVIEQLGNGDVAAALQSYGALADSTASMANLEPSLTDMAAAGGLHRALRQLSSEEQFDLLSAWTMPTDARPSLRIMTTMVPTVAPPAEFARALGERPRATSFPVATIGGVRGLTSMAWDLVQAAKDSGRLRRLMTELEAHAEQQRPQADVLLWLAKLSEERTDVTELTGFLDARMKAVRDRQTTASKPAEVGKKTAVIIAPLDVLIAAAALERPMLRERAESLFRLLLDETADRVAGRTRPFLQRAYATAVLRQRSEATADALLSPQFPHWVSVPTSDVVDGTAATWLMHEDNLLHLSGSQNDVLLFRYPLTGEFTFHCETQAAGAIPTDGALVYGGLSLFPERNPSDFTIWDTHGVVRQRGPNHYIRVDGRATFNQHAIVHKETATAFEINRHAVYEVATAATSPWLGLRAAGDGRPLFRHGLFSGNPVIPREVSLIEGDHTHGWQARTFGESQPEWFTIPLTNPPSAVADWTVSEQELRTNARPAEGTGPRESLLSYQRPLLDGETVTYEFQYRPGETEVHPAIGRVAFLLQPDGVRLHWITNGADEWTTLPVKNMIVEPLQRRGPATLPLKVGEWNRVALRRRGDDYSLVLNDTEIYQRTLDADDGRFGFYRDSQRFGVQVRNVTLTGDWPAAFPEELRQSPWSVTHPARTDAERHALNRLFDDMNFADDVRAVRHRAAGLDAAERLEYLTNWILPGIEHPGYRISGDFTPLDPLVDTVAEEVSMTGRGGDIVSPVYDWLDTAHEQQALPALRERVRQTPAPADNYQQRARLAVLALLDLELRDLDSATKSCTELLALVQKHTAVGVEDQWPETLVVMRAVPRLPQFGPVGDLLNYVYSQRTLRWVPLNINHWHAHLARLAMVHRRAMESKPVSPAAKPFPSDWVPGSRMRSITRGMGYPPAEWEWRDHVLTKIRGHEHDYLYYRYPLTGDYAIECDFGNPSQFRAQVLQAGLCIGPRPSNDEFEFFRWGEAGAGRKLEPKLGKYGPWIRYRAVLRDGRLTVALNGREVYSEPIADGAAPWVALHSWTQSQPTIRDFRILGNPTIPATVPMVTSPDLPGWFAYNVEEGWGAPSWALWKPLTDADGKLVGILGREFGSARGNAFESLFCYGRPMTDGDRIAYEFFYQPGKVEIHPSIDRTAFLFTPDGVREHAVTDCRYERTADPQNVVDVPEYRRNRAPLPLKADAWNHCEIVFREQRIQLRLNDELVYDRPFNPRRQATFGLFRYADLVESRVRNVVFRGDWPQSLPTTAEQSLARSGQEKLDADRSHMASVFEHNFVMEGLPPQYFHIPVSKSEASLNVQPDGLHFFRETTGSWGGVDLSPRFSMEGDFDAELTFADLQTSSNKESGLQFNVQVNDERLTQFRNIRTRTSSGSQELYASLALLNPDGTRIYPTVDHLTCEAHSGRLRLSRRGDQMHYLFAEADSPYFRLLWTEPASREPVDANGIHIIGACNGVGTVAGVVKHLRLRAEKLLWHPELSPAGPRALFVMKPDGTGLKSVLQPTTLGYQYVGSAEFSRDGKQIAMDVSQGSTATSHIVICRADGSDARDLGPGCMPSFSPDGKQVILSDSGIEIMNVDGTGRQVLDASGWGTQWSPDGKWIAYGKSGNVVLMDPKTRVSRTLLTGVDAQRYSSIYWNLGWSHDSQTVGFKARRRVDGEDEIAVIDINKPQGLQTLAALVKGINPDITFTAKNDGVVFGMQNPKVKGSQLHVIYRNKPNDIQVLPNQPENLRAIDAHWSRDGEWITFSGQELQPPTEWTAALAESKSRGP